MVKVPIKRKLLLYDVKEYLKLWYKFFINFALKRFVDGIFQLIWIFLFCRLITSHFA